MHNTSISFLFAAVMASVCAGAHAQAPGGDMSRYESIYEAHKATHAAPVRPTAHGIQPGNKVETIGPSANMTMGRAGGLGMSEAPQPVVRPGIPMMAGSTVSVAPGIVDKVPPQATSNADMPAPQQRTTEMITEDAKGNVVERSTVIR